MKVEELLQEIRRDFTAEKIASLTLAECEELVTKHRMANWQRLGQTVSGRSADMARTLLQSAEQTAGVMSGKGRIAGEKRPLQNMDPGHGVKESEAEIRWAERGLPELWARERAAQNQKLRQEALDRHIREVAE